MRRPEPADPEWRLLARTRRLITAQVTGAISLVLALIGVLVYGLMLSGHDASARRELAAAAHRGPVAHPPDGVWLFELQGAVLERSPGAPASLPIHSAIDRAARDPGEPLVGRTEIDGRAYLVHTQWRGDTLVQAVMDLRQQGLERRRLLYSLAGIEVAGLLAALLTGQVLARRAIAPLGEALDRRRRFVADTSHELRTPLARLHTRAQLVALQLRGGTDPLAVTEEIEQLVIGTRQLGEVVEDLLVSTQYQRLSQPVGPVDLAALAAEVSLAERARAQARGVTIEVCQGPGPYIVCGTESPLRRVISALVDNALRHTGEGGHIWVILTRNSAAMVQLTVRDDGAGLESRDAERLFTRYVAGSPRGFGLGLALVREVVDGHGGTITVDGRPGAGAAFTVTFGRQRK